MMFVEVNTMKFVLCLLMILSLALPAGARGKTSGDPLADQLCIYMDNLQKAIRENKIERAADLTLALFPDEERLKKALIKGIDKETVRRILAFHSKFQDVPHNKQAGMLAVPAARSEVKAYGATGREIAENRKGSVVFAEFPGGAVKLAQSILNPEMRFYEVECTEPGKSSGTKFHLFFFDGEHWNMLGPLWRIPGDK